MSTQFQPIAVATVTSSVSSVSFSNIPSTYNDLLIYMSARSAATTYFYESVEVRLNGTTSGYTHNQIYQDAGSDGIYQSQYSDARQTWINSNKGTANCFSNTYFYIPNYKSDYQKVSLGDYVAENNSENVQSGIFGNNSTLTAAVTSIDIVTMGGNFMEHSTFYLYGIKNS